MKTIMNIIYPAFALVALACFALAPQARATCQEGCDTTNGDAFLGENALINDTGGDNTAIGFNALFSNASGLQNTAIVSYALRGNIIGDFNTAIGFYALYANTLGNSNTATGWEALVSNTAGANNTATGVIALATNSTGISNTATGSSALVANTTGNKNTANGQAALQRNVTGSNNTAIGQNALSKNTTGSSNIAIGILAGFHLTTGDNNTDIFDQGVGGEANTIRIGTAGTQQAAFIAGISGATVPTGVAVIVDSTGHLGTTTSSARFKEAIKPMDKASETVLSLHPVTFRYKHELDPHGIPQFGLVAEEVEKVNPDLVARDEQGKPYTVRYEAVNAMLLNEFLKEHRKLEDLKNHFQATVAQQQKDIAALTAIVKEQAQQIQKVSAQLETSRTALQVVENR